MIAKIYIFKDKRRFYNRRDAENYKKQTGHNYIVKIYTSNAENQNLLSKPDVQIGGVTSSADADCSALRERIAELEEGLRQISRWSQSDQDNYEMCVMQWRCCVAIARELLKPKAGIIRDFFLHEQSEGKLK